MEDQWQQWQIIFTTLYGGVVAWLLYSQYTQGKQIVSITTTMDMFMKTMESNINDIQKKQTELDTKLNLFLKSELDTLKDLAKATRAKTR